MSMLSRHWAAIVGLAAGAFCVGVAGAVLLERPLLERVVAEKIAAQSFNVAEGLPELLSALVFLPAVGLLGPRGMRMGAFAGSIIFSAISLGIYDHQVASKGGLLAIALPLHPYATIQVVAWTAGALIGAICEGWVLGRLKRK